ncbi:MAG TPA: sigma-70 family RNA polymerase sigma factor [Dehalococcoidia bacterium]|jgi:RNA polymerase sigma-70 factor (ECF subfamily)|nr:sigma-70 family RNA polymerase sigma factor [Dehalococcoidia bacterium]
MRNVSPDESLYRELDDEELMQRLVLRDLTAFRTLYARYSSLVYSAALRVVRDTQIAEDMVQEIFLRLWRKPESYTATRGKFATWLTSVTRNRAVDEVRSRGRRYRHETASPEEQERELPGPDTDDPALTAELSDQRRLILTALSQLPPEQRQTIELAYFGGLTQQEIAERLGQPLGTVKTRIRLGMQKLRTALTPELRW